MLLPVKAKVTLAGLAVTCGAAMAAVLGPAGPAVGQASQPIQLQLQVDSPATLVAKGAGVEVLVTNECSGAPSAYITVSLTERAGSELAVGLGNTTVGCTNTSQTVQLLVTPQPTGYPSLTAGKAFKRGTAIALANMSACTADFSFCGNQQVQQTIQIEK